MVNIFTIIFTFIFAEVSLVYRGVNMVSHTPTMHCNMYKSMYTSGVYLSVFRCEEFGINQFDSLTCSM